MDRRIKPPYLISSADEMISYGRKCAKFLPARVICFEGDLGAGKTTFIKGLIAELSGLSPDQITSPTFNIVSTYGDILHLDCYRLQNEREFLARGLDEAIEHAEIVLIEWPSKIADHLPSDAHWVHLEYSDETTRIVHGFEF